MDPTFYNNLFTIDPKTLISAAKGGAIIAVASSIYYFLFGGILGMSGLAGSLIKFPTRHATLLKALVILGMLFASSLLNYSYHRLPEFHKTMSLPFDSPAYTASSSITHLAVAGFLVGLGTELANGCTSGHGLCGMPRFSVRSFLSVIAFLVTAIATATFSLKSYIPEQKWLILPALDKINIPTEAFIGFSLVTALILILAQKSKQFIAKLILFIIGIVFGCGLMIAGMSQRTKIYGFLTLDSKWDPSLLFVLMTGVLINIITFNLIINKKPRYGQKLDNPQGKPTLRLLIGSIIFGLGWGIGGLCPGPFLLSLPYSLKVAFYWGIPFFVSQSLSHILFGERHGHQEHEKKFVAEEVKTKKQ